ncbi:MAG: TetR family transcriptional regulator C-terminal domain-containing protein, partial [Pseudomonadales bacterium]
LLIETLRCIDNEYKTGWDKIIASDGSTVEKITALVEFDFSSQIAKVNKIAVWFAFWGEANSRPTYQKICAQHDSDIAATFTELCEQLIAEGKYRHVDADIVATGYTALADGLWLDLLMTPKELSKNKAKRVCMSYLAGNFPKHFSIE